MVRKKKYTLSYLCNSHTRDTFRSLGRHHRSWKVVKLTENIKLDPLFNLKLQRYAKKYIF